MSRSTKCQMNTPGMVTDEILNKVFVFQPLYQPSRSTAKESAEHENYAKRIQPKYVIANKNQLIKNAIRRNTFGN